MPVFLLHKLLYIPYGSNKTEQGYKGGPWFYNFISHMVQIKQGLEDKPMQKVIVFISHMVQIKLPMP